MFYFSQGCVHIFLVSMMKECLRNWSKGPTVDGIPSVTIEQLTDGRQITYICWKVHDDWVTEVKYIRSVKAVISSCNEEETALVIGCVRSTKNFQQKMNEIQDAFHNRNGPPQPTVAVQQKRLSCDETVFIISKGAKTFDFCKENNLVATGGLDKIVRLWNPHLPRRPIGMLQGHISPVIFLNIDEGTHRLFSIALDKIIKVWDIEDQICLVTVKPIASKISGDLAACYYSQELKALYLATDALALLRLQSSEEQNKGVSHNEPVLCCLYNKLLRQIVTCCEESVVKVWDLDTGSPVLEFTTAHGDAAITCMTFDISERRLITGSRDGSVKKWNYQNGQCIQTLKQVGNRTEEVTDCIYTEIFKNGYIISVGWDKRINVFPDIQDNCDTQYPLLHWEKETENGHKDDILSVVLCAANLLATSSYGGEVIVWNFVSSFIFSRLLSPTNTNFQELSDEDLSINKLLCISSRAPCERTSATLVASGPRGCIHFWNIFHGGKLLAHFPCSAYRTTVTSMTISEDSSLHRS
ncbi:WD repeat-containing protein 49-like [Leucoraja erinacea]|uniref:WD repeat-containing protein 49-like n=1 Tax=Leucoraja erinaceus TaxID=7782 RepID=UPI002457C929|nr:WD repeat-containing protein 49-like [Leucoraja erinacea]